MYHFSAFIHLLAVSFWIGGMLFTVAVLVPASRHRLFEANRGTFFKIIGEKFSRISWVLFLVLIITGITSLIGKGYAAAELVSIDFWQNSYGQTLKVKLYVFSMILIFSGVHDFWLGPKAAQLMDEQSDAQKTNRFRKASRWIGRINLILGLTVLYYAIQLVRGGW